MHVMLFLVQHLWHTREEIEAAKQAEKAAKKAAEEEAWRAAEEEARQRARGAPGGCVRMLDGDGTIYGPEQEQGVAGAEQLVQERDEADV